MTQSPCVACGSSESSDGDWYRICGPCRWLPDRAASVEVALGGPTLVYLVQQYDTEYQGTEGVCRSREAAVKLAEKTKDEWVAGIGDPKDSMAWTWHDDQLDSDYYQISWVILPCEQY
jgi:hypothetical protein